MGFNGRKTTVGDVAAPAGDCITGSRLEDDHVITATAVNGILVGPASGVTGTADRDRIITMAGFHYRALGAVYLDSYIGSAFQENPAVHNVFDTQRITAQITRMAIHFERLGGIPVADASKGGHTAAKCVVHLGAVGRIIGIIGGWQRVKKGAVRITQPVIARDTERLTLVGRAHLGSPEF